MLLSSEFEYCGHALQILWTGTNVRISIDDEQMLSAPSGPGGIRVWVKAARRLADQEFPTGDPPTVPRKRPLAIPRYTDTERQSEGTPGRALRIAAIRGDTEAVNVLVSSGANVDSADPKGWTPLMLAAKYGHTDLVRLLCDRGAIMDTRHGHIDRLLHRYERNPTADARNRNWGRVRLHAAVSGHAEILALLFDRCDCRPAAYPDGESLLIHAILWGHFDTVKVLLDRGLELYGPPEQLALARASFSATALWLAVRGGDQRIVRLLLPP
ncbi:MAG: ankyrin repeat domain-containing protein [Armatimonadota bacterium]